MADDRRRDGRNTVGPARTNGKETEGRVNCFLCRHFFITYDPNFPYGCKAAGFRSRNLPAEEVFISSGMQCLLYAEKEKIR
jgi:hypothetical protein